MEQAELKDYSEASSLSIPITFESFEVAGDFGPVGMAKHQTGSLVDGGLHSGYGRSFQ